MKEKKEQRCITTIFLVVMTVASVLAVVPAAQASGGLATADLDSGLTPDDLVNTLLGGGVAVSGVSYSGVNIAAGTFSGGTGIIGFEDGILLSTGNIADVIGPNTADDTTTDNSMPGDADLDTLLPGYTTFDAAVLEFDFVPTSDVVTFEYVFGSEEYNEYVFSDFNNVFGFFVNGVNVALIPGTSTPVAINNVNGGNPYGTDAVNPEYFRNNDLDDGGGLINTGLDGLTVAMTVTANVNAGEMNHIKLAVADAGDAILDSDVFIRAASFTAPKLTLSPLTDTNQVGASHELTATLVDEEGATMPEETITFTVTTGPNVGLTGTGMTGLDGTATWNYIGAAPGTDTIVATGAGETSNKAYKTWEAAPAYLCPDEYRWSAYHTPGYEWDPFPTLFRSWNDVHFVNSGPGDAFSVTASISYAPANINIVDGDVTLGDISAGSGAWSSDFHNLEVDMTNLQDPNEGIKWTVEYDDAGGTHHVIEGVPQFCAPG
ncbi:MAG: choice-of-anchor L domain-containing protein [Euryarchaeota archaeon]|nr:choice-of-anchor L domain-containing protein [Euryarchaeota archaeon]